MRRCLLLVVLLVAVLGTAASAVELTYVDLVKKLTDLEALAVLPVPGESCAQWSSYDRASAYDASTGKYVGWDANGDGNGIIRTEGEQEVFAEIEGPGVIWRIWSAAPRDGHVRIYLDGAAEPVVDMAFKEYFDLQHAPFVYSSLVHYTAQGANSYVPIPFQKSCKITADKGWGLYYHFTYTKFSRDTVVPTFTRELGPKERLALKTADSILSGKVDNSIANKPCCYTTTSATAAVAPGKKTTVFKVNGKYAITALKVKLDKKQYTEEELAGLVLKIYWDGEKEPSVWTPLVNFFGSAPGINNYKSLPLGITDDGLYSQWYMPFAKSAVIELENEGTRSFEVPFDITYAPISKPIGELGRFHAKWHGDAFLPTEPERWIDWPMLMTQGRGRFCGVSLEIWNPRGGWWGEGDEKFFVDGEKFPSTIGTGSEDYFGYAWGNPAFFQNAYHNQPRSDGNRGHISVNRWHIVDNVPFQKSYEADIEKYYPNKRPATYACVSYWYLAPGGVDPYKPVKLSERLAAYVPIPIVVVPGVVEGEKLKVVSATAGKARIQELADERWSNLSHMWWTDAKVGDKLTLALPVEKAGKYELKAQLTKAVDYAIVQLYLDGQKLGNPIDLYNADLAATGQLAFGTHELTAGDHQLGVEIVGKNTDAVEYYMFGLDYVKLDPVK